MSRRFRLQAAVTVSLVLICIACSALALDGTVPAEETEVVFPDTEQVLPSETGKTNAEAAQGYISRALMGGLRSSAKGTSGKSKLSGRELLLYNELSSLVAQVAAGTWDPETHSTEFAIPVKNVYENLECHAADLGVADFSTEENKTAAKNAYYARIAIDLGKVVDALLADYPYDLYWFDKTVGVSRSGPFISMWTYGDDCWITLADYDTATFTVSMAVAQEYSASGTAGTYTYNADVYGTAVQAAAAEVEQILGNNAGKSDLEMLIAYKDAICALTDYNHDAANNSNTAYGNPWQLVWVFDGNENTKVVCEGYSKAFQYLCDRSIFTGDVYSILVTGTMGGGTGEGPHMWNIVTMNNGKKYMADVTNSDSGSAGENGQLFLKGYTSLDNGLYRYQVSETPAYVTYRFDEDTTGLYSASELAMEADDYQEGPVLSWNEIRTLISSGESPVTITLNGNAAAEGNNYAQPLEIPGGKTVILDLNGYTLDRGRNGIGVSDGYAIHVSQGATLILKDSRGGGKLTGAYDADDHGSIFNQGTFTLQSGAVYGNKRGVENRGQFSMTGGSIENTVEYGIYNYGTAVISGGELTGNDQGVRNYADGNVTISGGTITGNKSGGVSSYGTVTLSGTGSISENRGGVILYNSGVLNMTGGSICGNTGERGAVYVYDYDTVFTMTGGEISGNTSAGGAIQGDGVVNLKGGRITGNTSTTGAAGIGTAGFMAVYAEGNIVISGNTRSDGTDSNLYLNNSNKIHISAGGIGDEAEIHLSLADGLNVPRVFADGLSGNIENIQQRFVCDDNSYTVQADGTNIVVGIKRNVTFEPGEGGQGTASTVYAVSGKALTLPECAFTPKIAGQAFAGWSAQGSSAVMSAGSTYTINADTVFYANWDAGLTVSFDGNGAEGSMAEISAVSGAEVTLPPCGFTAPAGQVFDGWLVGESSTPVAAGTKITVTADTVVKAKWKKTAWRALQDAINAGEGTYTVTLTENATAGAADTALIIEAGKTVTLDLNGFTIDRNCLEAPSYSAYAFYIQNGATLIISDGSAAQTGAIRGGGYNENSSTRGCLLNYGTLRIEGGNITGNYYDAVNNYGTFTLTGGSISGNGGAPGNAVEIAVENREGAQMTMSGGSISGNTTYGVWNYGTLTLSSGSIANNTKLGLKAGEGAATTITGGTISGNGGSGDTSGGISNYNATMTISGGTITGNTGYTAIQSNGPDAALILTGGTVANNHAGGVWIMGGSFSLGDGVTFGNNVSDSDSYSCDIALGTNCRIGLFETLNLTDPIIVRTTDVLQRNKPIVITEGFLDENGTSRVSVDMITDKGSTASSRHYKVIADGELAFSLEETYVSDVAWNSIRTQISEGESPVSIKLTMNTMAKPETEPLTIPAGKTVTIDLNGYKLDRNCLNNPGAKSYAIEIKEGAALTITDSSAGQAGQITGAYADSIGCIINHGTLTLAGGSIAGNMENGVDNYGTFTINGGSITGNGHTEPKGGSYSPELAVNNVPGGVVEMNGGSITGNTAHGMWNYGTFTFNGGTISGNTGSGAIVFQDASLTMNGGTISGNGTENYLGGGISNYGTVTVTGGEISGNKGINAIDNHGTLSISGGSIRNNLTRGILNSGLLYLSGDPEFGNNVYTEQESTGGTYTESWDIQLADDTRIHIAGNLDPAVSVTVYIYSTANNGTVITEGLFGGEGHLQASCSSFTSARGHIRIMRNGELAFAWQSSLAMDTPDFILPAGIREIEAEAFAGTGARVVRIPSGATAIGSGAFADTGLEQIYIPASVTAIAEDAFDPDPALVIFGEWSYPPTAAQVYAENHENISFVVKSN